MPPWSKSRFIGWKKINSQRYRGKRSCSFNLFVFCASCTIPMTHWGHGRSCFSDTRLSWEESASACCHPWSIFEPLRFWEFTASSKSPSCRSWYRKWRSRGAEDYSWLFRANKEHRLWFSSAPLRRDVKTQRKPACGDGRLHIMFDMGSHEVDKGSTIKEKSARWIRQEVQKIEKESWKKQSVLRLFVRNQCFWERLDIYIRGRRESLASGQLLFFLIH